MKTPHINDLMKFLDTSPTSYQAAGNIENALLKQGFIRLEEAEPWKLSAGKRYFVARNQSAVIAFSIGKKKPHQTGYRLAASHLDSPALKIKPEGLRIERNNAKLTVEIYGGPIISTWLDRELSIAGRIMVKKSAAGKKTAPQWEALPIDLKKPLVIIPNAARHLNREINKGFEYNAQNHLPAILQASEQDAGNASLKDIIARDIKLPADHIGAMDLFLYDPSPAARIGVNSEILVSGRLDNLAMSHAILASILESEGASATNLAVFFDHEEIGSTTAQGANSSFMTDILQRIGLAMQLSSEQSMIAIRKSFLISADMAHAVHPNFAEKHDPAYMPLMNHGPVIKQNAFQRYATTAASCARFEAICSGAGVPVQTIINRSDLESGTTIGPIASAKLSIPAVDIGNPMWAMHSIRETMGVFDHEFLIKALTHYYKLG
jgi:aspartyl aminopeptidase